MSRKFRRLRDVPEVRGRSFSDRDLGPESVSSGGRPSVVGSTRSVPRREFSNPPDFYGGYGAPSPMRVTVSLRYPVRKVSPGRGAPLPPPASVVSQPLARWKALRVLQASPQVRFCVQRSVRRRVLHALGVAGSRGLRTYHRRESSQWSC